MLISADSTETSRKFRDKLGIPFPLVSDRKHEVADRHGVPIARKHPKAWLLTQYEDGFIQPAVFAFQGERDIFTFIQKPSMLNIWGAARRPTPEQILDAIRPKLTAADQPKG